MLAERLAPGGGAKGVVASLEEGDAMAGRSGWSVTCSKEGLVPTGAAGAEGAIVPLVSTGSGCWAGTSVLSYKVGASPDSGCGTTPEVGVCGSEDLSR